MTSKSEDSTVIPNAKDHEGSRNGSYSLPGENGCGARENGCPSPGPERPAPEEDWELVPDPPDGGYGWIIVLASALLTSITLSHIPCFGVFAVEFIEYFEVPTSSVSRVASIFMFMIAPGGVLVPVLLKRLGSKLLVVICGCIISSAYIITAIAPSIPYLYLTFGFMIGISSPACMISCQVAIQKYFHLKRARAISLSLIGPAAAIFVWPPVSRYLIDQYTWRGASLIFAAITLNAVCCGCLLRPPPMKRVKKEATDTANKTEDNYEGRKKNLSNFCVKYLTRIIMFFGWFGAMAGHTVVLTTTPIRAKTVGINKTRGALLLSIVGISAGLSRLVAGFVGDIPRVKRNALAGSFAIYCGLISCVSASFRSFELLAAYCAMFGIGAGMFIGVQGACIYDVVGLKNIARGYSITTSAIGLSSFICITIAGVLYDMTGSPTLTVISVGTLQMFGGALLCSIPFVQAYQKKKRDSNENVIVQLEKSPLSKLKVQSEGSFTHSVEHLGPPI